MDTRFIPVPKNSQKDTEIWLYPDSRYEAVEQGSATDGVNLSQHVTVAKQTQFDANVSVEWRRELFGEAQPQKNQILEIKILNEGEMKSLWIGIIDSVSQYTITTGMNSVQLIAKTKDQHPTWRKTKRVTEVYPMLTDVGYMVRRIALTAGMIEEDIHLPNTSFLSPHSNLQLADMTAWDMITNLFIPLGWLPWIDGRGKLRYADKTLMGRSEDIALTDDRVFGMVGSFQRTQVSRVRVIWRNPILKRALQQGRKLAEWTVTMGWFVPYLRKSLYFSDDKTQRAINTYFVPEHSVNVLIPFCIERYVQLEENKGRMELINFNTPLMLSLLLVWYIKHSTPDLVPGPTLPTQTVPTGRQAEGAAQLAFTLALLNIGTGVYEIWGEPFEWVHAKNTTEAFNGLEKAWNDDPKDIDCDLIGDEEHAKQIATKELIWEVRSADTCQIRIVDDPRIEHGDVLRFPDNSRFWVKDYIRQVERGSDAVLQVEGFLF